MTGPRWCLSRRGAGQGAQFRPVVDGVVRPAPDALSPAETDALAQALGGAAEHEPPAHLPMLLYGVLSFCFGIAMYLFGVFLVVPRYLLALNAVLRPINEWIVWYSGMPIFFGTVLILFDLLFLLDRKRRTVPVRYQPLTNRRAREASAAALVVAMIGAMPRPVIADDMVALLRAAYPVARRLAGYCVHMPAGAPEIAGGSVKSR